MATLHPSIPKVTGKHYVTDSLQKAQALAMQGVRNQNFKFKIIAENIANSDSTASTAGGDPYQRKQVVFGAGRENNYGIKMVDVQKVVRDKGDFRREFDPGHPAADESGYVKKPNVDRVIETVDLMTTKNTAKALGKIYTESTKMRRAQIELMR
jgi:flagellar basal-body rod protein FlgC